MPHDDILTYDQYAEKENGGFPLPYVVEAVHGKQHLTFYGSEHTNDPTHPQFTDLEERWKTFIADSQNPIAFVEGHYDELLQEETVDKSHSIIAGGEAQFMVYLARTSNVPVLSPEPDRLWEATELADEFGKDKVILYYFVRQLGFWNRFTKKPDIEKRATDMLGHMKETYQWEEVDFSIDGMRTLHEVVFGKSLDMHDRKWLYEITTPTPNDFVTNVIARRSGELRDEYLLAQVDEYWHKGYSPFAVFGAAHAIRLEPALRKLDNK